MGLKQRIRSATNRFRTTTTLYNLWQLPTSDARRLLEKVEGEDARSSNYTVRQFTADDLPAYDLVRPEARAVPRNYLNEGHDCVAAFDADGGLAAYAWVFVNDTDDDITVKRYFTVKPGDAYLHSDWTHPEHRRRGLHTRLTHSRIAHALENPKTEAVVTHVAVGLLSSEQAFRESDFSRTHRLAVTIGPTRDDVKNMRSPLPDWDPVNRGSTSLALADGDAPRIMVLDGDDPRAVAVSRELARTLGAAVIAVSTSQESLAARSNAVAENLGLPPADSPEYEDRLRQAILGLQPEVVVSVSPASSASAKSIVEGVDAEIITSETEVGEDDVRRAVTKTGIRVAEPGRASGPLVHAAYLIDGVPVEEMQYRHLSTDRRGDSRTETIRDPELAGQARRLFQELEWTGFAAASFDVDGDELVLTGVEPGLWDGYALATKSGANVVTAAVSHALGRERKDSATLNYQEVTMASPLEELRSLRSSRDPKAAVAALGRLVKPGTRWDVALTDLKGDVQSFLP